MESIDLPAPETGAPLHAARVMMVDDDPLLIDVVQAHLEDRGFHDFVATADPREAIAMLRRERPQLMLLDLVMPQMSGFDLLRAIRAEPAFAYLPVIVLTAESGPAAKLEALRLGATDFLAKPVDESELALRVRNTLAYQAYHDRLAQHDPVTGLPHGRAFTVALDEGMPRILSSRRRPAIISLTVPECRLLRDGINQAAADALARVVASRLTQWSRAWPAADASDDLLDRLPRVARLGDDRFALLAPDFASTETLEQRALDLLKSVAQPVRLDRHEVVPAPALGIALAPDDGRSADALIQSAELAAQHAQNARERRGMPLAFASTELNERSHRRTTLGLQLRGAAQRGELRVHYQPKVDLHTLSIVGAEALVRWQHPDLGLLPPGRFIALAEELGVIEDIGAWVLHQACQDAADWSRRGLGRPSMAVNVSKAQFVTGTLARTVRQALADSGLRANRLMLELTESMFMDETDRRMGLMHELKSLGLKLSIDDFGTGYSSLSYLKRLPVDELKVDRSFVIDLPGGHADLSIVQSVIDLGHRLGMSVTAEGVEQPGQLACLQQIGCDQYQGYLFSPPVPSEDFAALLAMAAPPLGTPDHDAPLSGLLGLDPLTARH